MPNHITNKLHFEGEEQDILEVRNYIKGEEEGQYIDFMKIATPPNYIFMGSVDHTLQEIFQSDKTSMSFMAETDTWSSWCPRYWGTKWNAYGLDDFDDKNTENTLYFKTAWSGVPRLIALLGNRFPKVTFFYEFADEDFGHNCGFMKITGGNDHGWRNYEYKKLDGGSKEAFDLASQLLEVESEYGKYYWDDDNQSIKYEEYDY